ncbi:hypothetical protein SAMN04488003_12251 [Loktanella fryxellensis]|uniref:Ammonia monooxygenase n=1 Tax=Loktanella fryxellensis TaxID=245187 RepID=A0A1H8HVC3_9RHOB|nr:AbrB family transcriptional regulator [Loktanella fryxellensis]SEN60330.1 hypothetical protein SAMN04488003_12251 [Loktanella fryxellensis]
MTGLHLRGLHRQRDTPLALGIGVASGLLGFAIGMPLPWMLGPMIGNTIAALMRLPVRGPDRLRPIVIPVIGVLLGFGITPEILGQLGGWALTLVLLPLFLCVAAGWAYVVYRRIGGYDPVTAYYAAMPGGVNEMLILGVAAGGNHRQIALAHAARILIVVLLVVLWFGLVLDVRATGTGPGMIALSALSVTDYLILGACAAVGAVVGQRIGLPAAPVFGPMILSGLVHALGWVTVAPPSIIVIAAQIVIGTVIGARFVGATLRDTARDLGIAVIASGGMLAIGIAFAAVIAATMDMPLAQAFLAYAPGGLTEMSLLTLTLGQDIAYVSVTHIIRIALIVAVASTVFRLIRR